MFVLVVDNANRKPTPTEEKLAMLLMTPAETAALVVGLSGYVSTEHSIAAAAALGQREDRVGAAVRQRNRLQAGPHPRPN